MRAQSASANADCRVLVTTIITATGPVSRSTSSEPAMGLTIMVVPQLSLPKTAALGFLTSSTQLNLLTECHHVSEASVQDSGYDSLAEFRK